MERRWFIKYRVGGAYGDSYCVVYGYPDFNWPRGEWDPIYKHEIPKEFWGLSIVEYVDYFEHNIKPKVRINHGKEKEEGKEDEATN